MTAAEYRAARLRAGLSQAQLARLLGVTVQTVKNREHGRSAVTEEAVVALRAVCLRKRA